MKHPRRRVILDRTEELRGATQAEHRQRAVAGDVATTKNEPLALSGAEQTPRSTAREDGARSQATKPFMDPAAVEPRRAVSEFAVDPCQGHEREELAGELILEAAPEPVDSRDGLRTADGAEASSDLVAHEERAEAPRNELPAMVADHGAWPAGRVNGATNQQEGIFDGAMSARPRERPDREDLAAERVDHGADGDRRDSEEAADLGEVDEVNVPGFARLDGPGVGGSDCLGDDGSSRPRLAQDPLDAGPRRLQAELGEDCRETAASPPRDLALHGVGDLADEIPELVHRLPGGNEAKAVFDGLAPVVQRHDGDDEAARGLHQRELPARLMREDGEPLVRLVPRPIWPGHSAQSGTQQLVLEAEALVGGEQRGEFPGQRSAKRREPGRERVGDPAVDQEQRAVHHERQYAVRGVRVRRGASQPSSPAHVRVTSASDPDVKERPRRALRSVLAGSSRLTCAVRARDGHVQNNRLLVSRSYRKRSRTSVPSSGSPEPKTSHTLVSCRFLSQKELDPDFVDFNSVNRRYHFPVRTYLVFRGAFAQTDPLIADFPTALVSPFAYPSNPTSYVDPFGLQDEEHKKTLLDRLKEGVKRARKAMFPDKPKEPTMMIPGSEVLTLEGFTFWKGFGDKLKGMGAQPAKDNPETYAEYLASVAKRQLAEIANLEWFSEWVQAELKNMGWLKSLPKCPCSCMCRVMEPEWHESNHNLSHYHPGAARCFRSTTSAPLSDAGQQCCYDKDCQLITHGAGAGTPDKVAPGTNIFRHFFADVLPFEVAKALDRKYFPKDWMDDTGPYLRAYLAARPPDQGMDAYGKPCRKNP